MKKLLAFLLAACNCTIQPIVQAVPPPGPNDIEIMRQKTVALIREDDEHRWVTCAGVWVDDYQILTAAHCVRPDGDPVIGYETYADVGHESGPSEPGLGRIKAIWVRAREEDIDLALLRVVRTPDKHPVANLTMDVFSGEHVNIVGHTLGIPFSWAPGWVDGVRFVAGPEPIEGQFTQVFGGAGHGNSGGGMWTDDGKLAGVCSFGTTQAPSLHYFVSIGTIGDFLARHGVI